MAGKFYVMKHTQLLNQRADETSKGSSGFDSDPCLRLRIIFRDFELDERSRFNFIESHSQIEHFEVTSKYKRS